MWSLVVLLKASPLDPQEATRERSCRADVGQVAEVWLPSAGVRNQGEDGEMGLVRELCRAAGFPSGSETGACPGGEVKWTQL